MNVIRVRPLLMAAMIGQHCRYTHAARDCVRAGSEGEEDSKLNGTHSWYVFWSMLQMVRKLGKSFLESIRFKHRGAAGLQGLYGRKC